MHALCIIRPTWNGKMVHKKQKTNVQHGACSTVHQILTCALVKCEQYHTREHLSTKKNAQSKSNKKKTIIEEKIEWIRYWTDKMQTNETQQPWHRLPSMCSAYWKCEKKSSQNRMYRKINFGKTKPLQIAFDTFPVNFVSFRCVSCALFEHTFFCSVTE